MASDNTLTFDQNPPHRPGLNELGGGAKENHPTRKPDPVRMACAEDFNQLSKQAEAQGRMVPLARIHLRFTAGNPFIYAVQAPGSNVTAASFVVTDNAAGDTTLRWKTGPGQPAGALPDVIGAGALQNDDTEIDRIRCVMTSVSGDPAVRVKTKLGATGTDAAVIIELF